MRIAAAIAAIKARKVPFVTLLSLFLFAPAALAAGSCYAYKDAKGDVLYLNWNTAADQFSYLVLARPGQPNILSTLNCTSATPVTCQLEGDMGQTQLLWHGSQVDMVMQGRLVLDHAGDDPQLSLKVQPGPNKMPPLPFKATADSECEKVVPSDDGKITVFRNGNTDKYKDHDDDSSDGAPAAR